MKIIGGIAALIIVIGVGWFISSGGRVREGGFAIDKTLLPATWEFTGTYATSDLIAQGEKNIATLTEKLKMDGADIYDLHLSLAQQYLFMGKGKDSYEHLLRAISENPKESIAFQMMGTLMDSLGAHDAAEEAFRQAITVQPQIVQNHLALINSYIKQNTESEKIEMAFMYALSTSGRTHNVLIEYAQWLEGKNDIARAVTVWEEVLQNDQGNTAVKEKIAQLKKKL